MAAKPKCHACTRGEHTACTRLHDPEYLWCACVCPNPDQLTMDTEAPLRDPQTPRAAPAHRGGPDTEVQAAAIVTPKAGTVRARVLQAFTMYDDGLTDAEIEQGLELRRSSVCGRRNELLRDGWIRDSGERRVDWRTGMHGIVWVLTDQGRAQLGVAA